MPYQLMMPGVQLETLCERAQKDLLLVAPFIKVGALERLLQTVSLDVQITCVTRWRIDEIAQGVSDLAVWTVLRDRPNAGLFLHPDLHAKYYRTDRNVLVGSANLTNLALGWSRRPNLELLVPLNVNESLLEFEGRLFKNLVTVNDSLYFAMAIAVERYSASAQPVHLADFEPFISAHDKSGIKSECWIPKARYPRDLYDAYAGNLDGLTSATVRAALEDLAFLQIIPGLSRSSFEACVAVQLLLTPLVQRIDGLLQTPQRFGAIRDWLASQKCIQEMEVDSTNAWQTLMRWLLYFWPERYQRDVPHHSEILHRIDHRIDR